MLLLWNPFSSFVKSHCGGIDFHNFSVRLVSTAKALCLLVLTICLPACVGILPVDRQGDRKPPMDWYSSCDKYLWTYKDMKQSMRALVDQHLLVIPNEKTSYELDPKILMPSSNG